MSFLGFTREAADRVVVITPIDKRKAVMVRAFEIALDRDAPAIQLEDVVAAIEDSDNKDLVPAFRGDCTCSHPEYDHAWGRCALLDSSACDCKAGWFLVRWEENQ